jgi:hypothetical protein
LTDTPVPDDFDLIVTGIKAQELLDNVTFQSTVNELSTQITNAILSTACPEVQKRQDLYMLHKALELLTTILKQSASAGAIINAQTPDDPEDVEETEIQDED